MIPVVCHTNLDLAYEEWPEELSALPHIGDIIESAVVRCNDFRLTLQVCSIRWRYNKNNNEWHPHIELHMTDFQKRLPSKSGRGETGSIVAFYEWYAPLVGRTVSSFI